MTPSIVATIMGALLVTVGIAITVYEVWIRRESRYLLVHELRIRLAAYRAARILGIDNPKNPGSWTVRTPFSGISMIVIGVILILIAIVANGLSN